jgi:hypothetical protein
MHKYNFGHVNWINMLKRIPKKFILHFYELYTIYYNFFEM